MSGASDALARFIVGIPDHTPQMACRDLTGVSWTRWNERESLRRKTDQVTSMLWRIDRLPLPSG